MTTEKTPLLVTTSPTHSVKSYLDEVISEISDEEAEVREVMLKNELRKDAIEASELLLRTYSSSLMVHSTAGAEMTMSPRTPRMFSKAEENDDELMGDDLKTRVYSNSFVTYNSKEEDDEEDDLQLPEEEEEGEEDDDNVGAIGASIATGGGEASGAAGALSPNKTNKKKKKKKDSWRATINQTKEEEWKRLEHYFRLTEGIALRSVGVRMNSRFDWVYAKVNAMRSRRECTIRLVTEEEDGGAGEKKPASMALVIEKQRHIRRPGNRLLRALSAVLTGRDDGGGVKSRRLHMYDLKEIRRGKSTSGFQRHGRWEKDEECFSLIFTIHRGETFVPYSSKSKTRLIPRRRRTKLILNFVASSKAERDGVCDVLKVVSERAKSGTGGTGGVGGEGNEAMAARIARNEAFWKRELERADISGDGKLGVKEMALLLRNVGRASGETAAMGLAKELMRRFDEDADGTIDLDEFQAMIEMWRGKRLLRGVFKAFTDDRGEETPSTMMTREQFRAFLVQSQGEREEDTARLDPLLASLFPTPTSALSFEEFCDYVSSPNLNPATPSRAHYTLDYSLPLAAYFISSSHNTYLTSDQLVSSGGVQGYVEALAAGFRCLEVDAWDGPGGRPVITHGHTATERCDLNDFLGVIKNLAFSQGDDTPIIVSLENHCAAEGQRAMASAFKEAFGDEGLVGGGEVEAPASTLERLRRKVVIKANLLSQVTEPELKRLTLIEIEPFMRGKEEEMLARGALSCLNLPEGTVGDPRNRGFLAAFSRDHLVRSYPAGTRVGSSNQDVCAAWSAGVQITALNHQSHGRPFRLNALLFQRASYVPKRGIFPPAPPLAQPLTLSVQVLSGHMLCPPDRKPWTSKFVSVDVELVEAFVDCIGERSLPAPGENPPEEEKPADTVISPTHQAKVFKTMAVQGNLFDPEFNTGAASPFTLATRYPGSSLLTFTVRLNEECILFGGGLVSDFGRGLRALRLMDRRGIAMPLETCLMIRVGEVNNM